jgi:hypothetical protein
VFPVRYELDCYILFYRKGSVIKISDRDPQGALRQYEMTGVKPPVVK